MTIVLGVLKDKDWYGMIDALAPVADHFIITQPLTAPPEPVREVPAAQGWMIRPEAIERILTDPSLTLRAGTPAAPARKIDNGTEGLVPVGTTGESPTLTHDEHKRVVEWCIAEAKGRVPVIAGAGSNSTREAVELARHAE